MSILTIKAVLAKFKMRIKLFFHYLHYRLGLKFSIFDRFWIKKPAYILEDAISSFVIYISSRNNYEMLENELLHYLPLDKILVINIDDGSTTEQQQYGKRLCEKYNVKFALNRGKGLQHGMATALSLLDEKPEFLLHMTHDNYPLDPHFFAKLERTLQEYGSNPPAMLGFNHLDYQITRPAILRYKKTGFACGLLGRAILTKLPNNKYWYFEENIDETKWSATLDNGIEAVCDMAFVVNTKALEAIGFEPNSNYRLHCWADDVGIQLLLAGFRVVMRTDLFFMNCQMLKLKYGIPPKSVIAAESDNNLYFSDYGPHLEEWYSKYGFRREKKETFQGSRFDVSGNPLSKIFHREFDGGPIYIGAEKLS